ncbi:MAG: hydroxysqualene dehydroxylase HpnE [Planctomycetota bacterium]
MDRGAGVGLASAGERGAVSARTDMVVVGGGVAGLAAAVRLAERGVRVTLVESRRRLGGRAASFHDPATGEQLDNCQHVALGCCTAYLDLCARLGSAEQLVWTTKQTWIERGGRAHTLAPDPLPAPGHMARGLLLAPFLSVAGRAAVARAVMEAASLGPGSVGGTFADWLRSVGQPWDAVRRFWQPLIVSACNLPPARVAAGPALQVVREGLLLSRRSSAIALAGGTLDDLYAGAPAIIERAGGRVLEGARAARVRAREVELSSGEVLRGERVVLATPFESAVSLMDPADPRVAGMRRLTHSPIIGVHLGYARSVMAEPHAVLVDCPTHWVFRKDDEGRRVHAVISAARGRVGLPPDEVARRVARDLSAWLPGARGQRPTWFRVVKERRATFAATPEAERVRPTVVGPGGPGASVLLAGDYVRTGWPATMEGAARAGYAAAAAALGLEAGALVTEPMAPAALSAMMGVRAVGAEVFAASGG